MRSFRKFPEIVITVLKGEGALTAYTQKRPGLVVFHILLQVCMVYPYTVRRPGEFMTHFTLAVQETRPKNWASPGKPKQVSV